MEAFVRYIRTLVPLDDAGMEQVLSRCRERSVPKGKRILRKGQVASQYFFLVSGGLRFFYESEAQEVTSWVMFDNEFFTEISSMNPQKPTRFHIEAVVDTELIVIEQQDMDYLYAHVPGWEAFGRKLWEAMSVRMIDQILNFQTLSAEERYRALITHPEWAGKIPVKQFAAILGITPNALSRIRKNIR